MLKQLRMIVAGALVVGLTMLLIVASGSAGGAPKPKPSPTPTPTPTSPPPPTGGFEAEKAWSATGDDWEPAIAADPRSGSNIVYQATTRYGGAKACSRCPDPAILVRLSTDAGATWGPDNFICACQGRKAQNDPEIEVANDGTIYAAWLNDFNPGVAFAKSSNGGATWTAPIHVDGQGLNWSDKPIIAISPSGQDVYIAFNHSDSYVVASHNFGASFSAPVQTNTDDLYWFAEGGAVAPNGNVYFSESGEVASHSASGDVQLAVLRSTNGGTSWTHTYIDTSKEFPPACCGSSADFFASQAAMAIDSAGKIMVAYTLNTTAGAPKALYITTSTDGVTWAPRTLVNSQGDSGFPAITAGSAAGDFRLAWQDDRGGAWNTYYRRTTDGGASFGTEVKLSNVTTGAPYKSAAGYAFPYGDYFEIDANSAGTNFVIWGEGPDYIGPGGSWFTRGV
ncbi:MAG: sialidase family protein [Actinomycetota bacterium]